MNSVFFVWDPDRNFFVIPYINHPVTWYGLLFALGFMGSYLIVKKIFSRFLVTPECSPTKAGQLAAVFTDRIAFLVVVGTVIGARLGHVFFYGWSYYRDHLLDIVKIWQGGLASHGALVGILTALFIFLIWNRRTFPKLTYIVLLDTLALAGVFAGGCIRFGNFMNQEITGIPTSLPWGVIFLHSVDGISGIPVHPVQLYESFYYFLISGFLWFIWRRNPENIGTGLLSGLCLILVFTFRFGIEFLKMRQGEFLSPQSIFSMGQILSVPFILIGIGLLLFYLLKKEKRHA